MTRLESMVHELASRSSAKKIRFVAQGGRLDPGQERPTELIFQNLNDHPVVLFLGAELTVRDGRGRPIGPEVNLPHRCMRRAGCALDEARFIEIPPWAAYRRRVTLHCYFNDPDKVVGWPRLEPGEYCLSFRWSFDRTSYVGRCLLSCSGHRDPGKPWNQAVEVDLTAVARLQVARGRR
jgi:hypothetical protein